MPQCQGVTTASLAKELNKIDLEDINGVVAWVKSMRARFLDSKKGGVPKAIGDVREVELFKNSGHRNKNYTFGPQTTFDIPELTLTTPDESLSAADRAMLLETMDLWPAEQSEANVRIFTQQLIQLALRRSSKLSNSPLSPLSSKDIAPGA